jgi:nucleoid DNA-binding protein
MVNVDLSGFCFSCADEECNITPPDLDVARERVHSMPEGSTLTMLRAIQAAFPDKFSDTAEAYMIFDAMKAIIALKLKNRDVVNLEGIGEFKTEPENGRKKVIFTPERVLLNTVNE